MVPLHRRGEPDTAPGRPAGDPPQPGAAAVADMGWGAPPTAGPSPDDVITVRRGDLERMVSDLVTAKLDPIAAAISDMREAMLPRDAPAEDASSTEVALEEPVALLPVLESEVVEAEASEPVAALPLPDHHDWTQGKSEDFAAPPAQTAS